MIFCHMVALAVFTGLRMTLSFENKRRDRRMHLDEGQDERNLEETAFRDMTDQENPNFRYVY